MPDPLDPVTAPGLGVPHGFLTRRGGVSTGLYASLNCGRGSHDDPDAVARNRALAAAVVEGRPIATLHQVHSARAVAVADAAAPVTADGLATAEPGLALGVLTADCAPVLLADPGAGVVGAAHAGWRGALGGVVEATVGEMERLGARPERIAAAIGPTIGPAAYEVGPEFVERMLAEDPTSAPCFDHEGVRSRFDLPGYVLSRLARAGVRGARWTEHCTYSEPSRFFSYRRSVHRSEPDYGRMIAVIAPNSP